MLSAVHSFVYAAALLFAQMRAGEQIVVERIIVDARVTDYGGEPITGLGPNDFEVRIDGKLAQIESVLWVPETVEAKLAAGLDPELEPENADLQRPGRLFVYFIQTDFARNDARIKGQMKFLPYADQMIEELEAGDRVAVFSFDSHLKFRLDFTEDEAEIQNTLRNAMAIDDPPQPRIVPNPSLARRLDREEMRRCTSPDEALIVVANALRNIPGPKNLVLFGWGMGHLRGRQVVMDSKYPIALRALESARVTIFALDMTIADYHDLEIGLDQAAYDTGGFYAKTHVFPRIAVDRLRKTLSGHYELEVRKPETNVRGTHSIDVRVKRRGAYVMARTTYVDESE